MVVDTCGNIKVRVSPNVTVKFWTPTDEDQCRKGGWQDYNQPRASKNQATVSDS